MTTPGPIGRIHNEQGSITKIKKNTLMSMLNLLEESVENRKRIAAMIEPHSEKFVNLLIDLAEGVLIETDSTKPYTMQVDGGPKPIRVYKRAPDSQALGKLLALLNTDTAQNATAFMAYSRALSVIAEIDARIARAKAANLNSQTQFTDKQTDAFEKSLVTEEEMTDAMLTMMYEGIGIFQTQNRESLAAASVSDDAFSKWIEHIGGQFKRIMLKILQTRGTILEEEEDE